MKLRETIKGLKDDIKGLKQVIVKSKLEEITFILYRGWRKRDAVAVNRVTQRDYSIEEVQVIY